MADNHAIPWELVPFERLGPIRLDASREEVLALVGEPKFREAEPGEDGTWLPPEDDYPSFSIEYDQDERVLGVECKSSQPVTYRGWLLTGRQRDEVEQWAAGHDLTVKWSWFHRTLWIPELSLSFWIPDVDYAPSNSITMVAAGRRDYWQVVPEPRDP